MEWKIISKLGLRLLHPSPMCFVRCFARYFNMPTERRSTLLETVKCLTELAVCDYGCIQYPFSLIALAAILCAFDNEQSFVSQRELMLWKVTIRNLSGLEIDREDVRSCKSQLEELSRIAVGRISSPFDNSRGKKRAPSPTCIDEFERPLDVQRTLPEKNSNTLLLTDGSIQTSTKDLTTSQRETKRRRVYRDPCE